MNANEHKVPPYFFIANNFLLCAAKVRNLFYFSYKSIGRILTNFYRGIMHTLENIGFLRMVVLLKQPLYGQILVELEEN